MSVARVCVRSCVSVFAVCLSVPCLSAVCVRWVLPVVRCLLLACLFVRSCVSLFAMRLSVDCVFVVCVSSVFAVCCALSVI